MNIYAGNLSYDTGDDELRGAFAAFGEVTSAKVIQDRETGRSKGFGFVELESEEAADKAKSELDGSEVTGRYIRVNEAHERVDRPSPT